MNILLQIQLSEATTGVASSTVAQPVTFFDLLLKGGFIMLPIILLSVFAIYIIIERYLGIKKASTTDTNLFPNLKSYIYKKEFEAASQYCKNNTFPIHRIIDKGLGRVGKPIKDIEASMENVARFEIAKMEKNLGYLGVIAGIAPMLGFIGTISGVIKIFYTISVSDNISIGIISGGLYEKMITSFAGLIVGVIAYSGYHLLQMMIDRYALSLEASVYEFTDLLQEIPKS